jgi:flagellar hook-associated protein 1 FlgK
MAGLLNIGVSGLLAYQTSLNTISQNIANVNTPGYSRQTTQLQATLPQAYGFGFTGTGVEVASITRVYDAYLENNMRGTTSTQAEFETFYTLASQLDNVMADADVGMSSALQRFFNAVQDVADSPADPTARQVLLNEGEQLAGQFNELSTWVENTRRYVNSQMTTGVGDINRITQSIAELNQRIVLDQGRAGGQPANDLLDQRDALILELSRYVSVNTLQQDDGAINVLVGKGQALVIGSNATRLETFIEAGDPNKLGIAMQGGGGTLIPITDQMTGGILGGAMNFRDRLLNQSSNSLGLTAIGMAEFFNQQQRQGMDISGMLGVDFFSMAQPQVLAINGTAGNVTAAFDDVGQLTNLDYTLQFNAGVWNLTRNDTGQAVAMAGSGTAADPFIVDGLSIEVTAAPVNGETYEIRPTRNGARDIEMILGSSEQIAAAAPVRSLSAPANTGSGSISAGVITDINNAALQSPPGQLTPPLLVQFTAGNSYDIYDNSNPAAPVLLEAGIAYDPTTGGVIFPTPGGLDFGYQMQLNGAPVAGDEFTTEYNSGGVGDNRNALALAALSINKVLAGGTTSVTDSYRNLVVDVGISTRQSELNSIAQKRVLDQVTASHDSKSGVNLDEEAANLVRFQQAYQAAAQVVATANSLFDTLLNAVRR